MNAHYDYNINKGATGKRLAKVYGKKITTPG